MLYNLRFFPSKCSLFDNSNVFGSCIIHILYTGVIKLKKNNSGAKRLISETNGMYISLHNVFTRSYFFLRIRKKDRIERGIAWVVFKNKSLTVRRTQILLILFNTPKCCGHFRPS